MAYDYIIVGAGSAGCVLANRLSADPAVSVLLLEAGGKDNKLEMKAPAAFSKLFKTAADWAYETVPQPHMNNRRQFWPRGKVLGGSSTINAMIYIRGAAGDYDTWAAQGASGWGFQEVLPVFRAMEHYEKGANEWHGTTGPLNVTSIPTVNPLTHVWIEAGTELGYPSNPDFNGASQIGFGRFDVTQKKGQRWSAADAYLRPVLGRPNLTVQTEAHVSKVLFDGQKRATGITYRQHGSVKTATATREVILAGGAINTPQLLMLSGVGPADHLRSHGIAVVQDLPGVGQNLQDHLVCGVSVHSSKPITLDSAEAIHHLVRYLIRHDGPVASNVAEGGAFIKTHADLPYPDLQFHFGPLFFIDHGFVRPKGYGITAGPTLLHPRSTGTITLASADPFAAPIIDPHYLEDPADMDLLVKGMHLAREIFQTKAFAAWRGEEYLPGKDKTTDADMAEHVRTIAQSIYHPVGTCKMGPASDPMTVVSPQLCVLGTSNLRVVDASVMPQVTSGNTNAPTIMIAQKAAGFINAGQ